MCVNTSISQMPSTHCPLILYKEMEKHFPVKLSIVDNFVPRISLSLKFRLPELGKHCIHLYIHIKVTNCELYLYVEEIMVIVRFSGLLVINLYQLQYLKTIGKY